MEYKLVFCDYKYFWITFETEQNNNNQLKNLLMTMSTEHINESILNKL
jgi:hypothetical protein